MKLTNMALDKDERKEYAMLGGSDDMAPKYPYCLTLYLGEDEFDKLGIKNAFPPGTIVKIEALGIIQSSTESVERDGDDSGNDVSSSIQITDLGIEPQGTATDAATRLYGKK